MNSQMVSIIEMPSITYAIKAQKFLRSKGYICNVRRISGNSSRGCSFSISVNEKENVVRDMLESNGIMPGKTGSQGEML